MGDEELDYRVRNGIGYTLFSMDTKEIPTALFDAGGVWPRFALGHVCLYTLPPLKACLPGQPQKSSPEDL